MGKTSRKSEQSKLKCSKCGNRGLFIQIITYQMNIVNGNTDHIKLLASEIDRYICGECNEEVGEEIG